MGHGHRHGNPPLQRASRLGFVGGICNGRHDAGFRECRQNDSIVGCNYGQGNPPVRWARKSVLSVAFAADGKMLASGSDDQTIRLWDVATGKEIRQLNGHQGRVSSVRLPQMAKRWSRGAGTRRFGCGSRPPARKSAGSDGHKHVVSSVAITADGKTLASGSWDQTVRLWDAATGQEIRSLNGHNNEILSVAFAPDGKTLASGSYGQEGSSMGRGQGPYQPSPR